MRTSASEARLAIEAVGAPAAFLPAYSPDFNPIEWPSPRSRRTCALRPQRTPEGLLAATATAIDAITAADARGFYAHCGFSLPVNYYASRSNPAAVLAQEVSGSSTSERGSHRSSLSTSMGFWHARRLWCGA